MTAGGFRMMRCGLPGVDAVEAATNHVFPKHMHEQFGIGVIGRGAQKSLSGRGIVEAGPGNIITVNAGEVHDGSPIGDHGRSWRMLYFDPALIYATVTDISEGGSGCSFEFSMPVIDRADIAARFSHLYAAATEGGNGLLCEEALLSLLAALLPAQGSSRSSRAVPSAIARARALIDDSPADPVTLAALAGESGLSRFQLLRGFSRACGMTPHAYMLQRRINLARRLIAARMPLARAAAEAGFADQSHMTRQFRRSFGISPGEYAGTAR